MEKYSIKEEYLGGKREEYLQIDATYMVTAMTWAARSKDPSTQVGACFVNEKGRIISVGYNGSPNKWDDNKFPWGKDNTEGDKNTKYPYVIHAEMNAIMNYGGALSDFNNSTLYVTLFPCSNCAKFLAQVGVKKIVYLSDKYNGLEDNDCAKILFNKCGIDYVQFNSLNKKGLTTISFDLVTDNEKEQIKIKSYKNN